MTINAWFSKNAKKPLLLLGLLVLGVQVSFIYHHIASNEIERAERITSLVHKIANTAIEQKNRDIIEATFQVAVEELGAKNVLLCKGGDVFVSFPYSHGNCKSSVSPNWFERQMVMKASGYSDYRFIFLLPRWNLSSTFLGIVLLTLGSMFICFFIIFRVQRKLKTDIFMPLERQLFSSGSMEIVELDNLKTTINKIHQSDRDAAILKAKKESEAKFVHNIQSPLGNIRILKERLKPQLDPESAKLFESVVSEISEVTLNYTKRSANRSESLSEQQGDQKALIELSSIVEDSVSTKKLELTTRTDRPELIYKSHVQGQIFTEASLVELRSILSNILNNAVDSGAKTIELSLHSDGAFASLAIRDNGGGVSPEIQQTLFEKDVTFGKAHGTGFGLFHARTFLSRWGGSIALQETSPEGSVFLVHLPLARFPEVRIGTHHQIVILEDKRHERLRLRKRLFSALPALNLNQIIEFDGTAQALEWFERTDVPMSDIVLFADNDLGDSQMSGLEMIRGLGIASLSYLVTNSYGSEELVFSCREIGLSLFPKSYVPELKIIPC